MTIGKAIAKHRRCYPKNNVVIYPDENREILFLT